MQWRNQRQQLSHSLSSVSLDDLDPPSSQTNARRTPSEAHPLGVSGNSLKPTPAKPDMSPALIAQTNWNFVEKLLKVSLGSNFIFNCLIYLLKILMKTNTSQFKRSIWSD